MREQCESVYTLHTQQDFHNRTIVRSIIQGCVRQNTYQDDGQNLHN